LTTAAAAVAAELTAYDHVHCPRGVVVDVVAARYDDGHCRSVIGSDGVPHVVVAAGRDVDGVPNGVAAVVGDEHLVGAHADRNGHCWHGARVWHQDGDEHLTNATRVVVVVVDVGRSKTHVTRDADRHHYCDDHHHYDAVVVVNAMRFQSVAVCDTFHRFDDSVH